MANSSLPFFRTSSTTFWSDNPPGKVPAQAERITFKLSGVLMAFKAFIAAGFPSAGKSCASRAACKNGTAEGRAILPSDSTAAILISGSSPLFPVTSPSASTASSSGKNPNHLAAVILLLVGPNRRSSINSGRVAFGFSEGLVMGDVSSPSSSGITKEIPADLRFLISCSAFLAETLSGAISITFCNFSKTF